MDKATTIKEVNQVFIDQGTAVAIIVILVTLLAIYFGVKIWIAKGKQLKSKSGKTKIELMIGKSKKKKEKRSLKEIKKYMKLRKEILKP